MAHIPVKKSVVRKNCLQKPKQNCFESSSKMAYLAHIPAEKSVVRQNALKSS